MMLHEADLVETAAGEIEDDVPLLAPAHRGDAGVLLASLVATTAWQAEERLVLLAFVKWLEVAAELSERGVPTRKPREVERAWSTWVDRTRQLARRRRLGRVAVARFLRGRELRRATARLAFRRWAGTEARGLAVALLATRLEARRLRLAKAFQSLRSDAAVSEEVARVAAEHLDRVSAQNRHLRKAARRGAHLAARVIAGRASATRRRVLQLDAWRAWTTHLRAPKRARRDDVARALADLEPNKQVLRDIFDRYGVGGTAPDGGVTIVLPLERFWSFAKDFALSPGYASYSLLMQLAHDQIAAPNHARTNSAKRRSVRTSPERNKPPTALRFDQFLSLVARVALLAADDDDNAGASADHVASLVRTMDCSGGLPKVGLLNRRFSLLPKPSPRRWGS